MGRVLLRVQAVRWIQGLSELAARIKADGALMPSEQELNRRVEANMAGITMRALVCDFVGVGRGCWTGKTCDRFHMN